MDFYPITKTIYELFQLIGTGKYLASAMGVWAMGFLAVTILGGSRSSARRWGGVPGVGRQGRSGGIKSFEAPGQALGGLRCEAAESKRIADQTKGVLE